MSPARRPAWCPRLPRTRDNALLRDWLRDRGSLTTRLQNRGRFAVHVLRQGIGRPTADEAGVLGLSSGHRARIREVALSCNEQIVVFAHTVLPLQPLGPLTRWLKRLGNRSLGALLFSHAGFKRGLIAFHRLDHRDPLFRSAHAALQLPASTATTLWARRSHFVFGSQSVLVSEVFSPALLNLPNADDRQRTRGTAML